MTASLGNYLPCFALPKGAPVQGLLYKPSTSLFKKNKNKKNLVMLTEIAVVLISGPLLNKGNLVTWHAKN